MSKQDQSGYPNAYRYRRIVQAKRYIDDHFTEDINLNDISDEANFSKYHFLRIFKKAYGKTPNEYLTEKKLEHARRLLETGTFSISEVCFKVGFESLGSFSSLFKRAVGDSPSVYRRRVFKKKRRVKSNPRSVIPACFAQTFY